MKESLNFMVTTVSSGKRCDPGHSDGLIVVVSTVKESKDNGPRASS